MATSASSGLVEIKKLRESLKEKENVIVRLMGKVAHQGQELNDLNDSLVESRQYSESCERRVADLENSIYAQAAGRPTKGSMEVLTKQYKERVAVMTHELENIKA